MKIGILEPEHYSPQALSTYESFSSLQKFNPSQSSLEAFIRDLDVVVIKLGYHISKSILKKAKNLKMIASPTTGLNHIDLTEAKKRNIKIISLQGETEFLSTISATAELTWGIILSLIRHIPEAKHSVLNGHWDRNAFLGEDLNGKTLGIIGFGRLGKFIAQYAEAFGMTLLTYDKKNNASHSVPLNTLLRNSDIVTLHLPLTHQTKNFLTTKELSIMKPSAYLINTSRGEIINEKDLLEALKNQVIRGAALDVLAGETKWNGIVPQNSPLINYIKTHSNLLIVPHLGGASIDAMHKTECFIAQKVKNFLLHHSA